MSSVSCVGPVYTRIWRSDRFGRSAANRSFSRCSSAAAVTTTAAAMPRARVMAASAAPERAW